MAYDVHVEPMLSGQPVSVLEVANTGGKVLTFGSYRKHVGIQGVQKMVNRFLKCLLTPLGTDVSDLTYGTLLMSMFTSNIDTRTVLQMATKSVFDAETKIKEYDAEYSYPEDERLRSVEVTNSYVTTDSTGVVLEMVLTNVAGTKVKVLTPVAMSYNV